MNKNLYEQLELSISKDRLEEYKRILKTNKTKTVFTYYILNSELSKSWYIPLQNLEVTLRNNFHNVFTKHFKTDKWYEIDNFLEENEIGKIESAKYKISKSRKKVTPSRVISELNFGFWTALFSTQYEQKIWIYHSKNIFPNIPNKNKSRKILSSKLNTIRYFRNRIFHFEPIFKNKNLNSVYIDVLNMIKWLNQGIYKVTLEFDEFNDICKNETKNTIKKLNNINQNYS